MLRESVWISDLTCKISKIQETPTIGDKANKASRRKEGSPKKEGRSNSTNICASKYMPTNFTNGFEMNEIYFNHTVLSIYLNCPYQ